MTYEVWARGMGEQMIPNARGRPRTGRLVEERKDQGPFADKDEAERTALRLSEKFNQQFFVKSFGIALPNDSDAGAIPDDLKEYDDGDGDGGTVPEPECVRSGPDRGDDSSLPPSGGER